MTGGSGSEGGDGWIDVMDGRLGCPAVVIDHDLSKAIFGITPPSQDSFAVEGDFETCFVKKYLAATLHRMATERQEIVDKAGELMH
jgi:hypothetical protein